MLRFWDTPTLMSIIIKVISNYLYHAKSLLEFHAYALLSGQGFSYSKKPYPQGSA